MSPLKNTLYLYKQKTIKKYKLSQGMYNRNGEYYCSLLKKAKNNVWKTDSGIKKIPRGFKYFSIL